MPETTTDFSPESGAVNDDTLNVLLDVLAGKGKVDSYSLLRGQLEAQNRDNPQVAMLLRLLERQQAEASDVQGDAEASSEEVAEQEKAAEEERLRRAEDLKKLEETVQRVYAELEALRVRNDALAAALGACHLCFGDDPLCPECGGRGVPGSLAPEPTAFRKYVLPAFRRAKALEDRRAVYAPKREPPPNRTSS